MIGVGVHLLAGTRGVVVDEPYAPSWVDNTGTGWLSYDGGAFGTDSGYLEIALLVRSLNTNPAAVCRMYQTSGARVDVRFAADGKFAATINNTSGTALVAWTSDAAQDGSGEWLFHIAVDLDAGDGTATPTFVVTKSQLTAGAPGAFSSVAGTFSSGPTAGTIDNARGGFASNELAVFATTAGGNIASCDLGYLWVSHAAPLGNSAFASGGELFDPATVGSPVILVTGPAAALSDDKGSANLTLVVNGTWTDS